MGSEDLPQEVIYQAKLIVARSNFWTPDTEKLLRRWKKQIRQRYLGHKNRESYFKCWLYGIGIPMTILGAVSAAGVLTTFQNCDSCGNVNVTAVPGVDPCARDIYIRITMGILSAISASLSALFLFMDFGGSQKAHKDASSDCDALAREIDEILIREIPQRGDPVAELQKIRNKFDVIIQNTPSVPANFRTALDYAAFEKRKGHSIPAHMTDHYDHSKVVRPPSSNINMDNIREKRHKKIPDAGVLAKIIMQDMEKADKENKEMRKKIQEANDYDTDDEDREVTIPFDPESIRPGDILEDEKTRIVRESLQRAMHFELSRFDESLIPHYNNPLDAEQNDDIPLEIVVEKEKDEDESTVTTQSQEDLFDHL